MGRLARPRAPAPASPGAPAHASIGDLNRLARGGTLNLAGGVVNGLFGFLLVVVLTRGLLAQGAGAFFEAVAITTIAAGVAAFGADVGLVRMLALERARSRTADLGPTLVVALVPVTLAGAVAAALIVGFAEPLAHTFGRGVDQALTATYLRVLGPFVPVLAAYTATVAATRGFGTMVPNVAIDRIGTPVVQPILVAAVIAAGGHAAALGLAYAVPIAAGLAVAIAWTSALVRRASARAPDAVGRGGRARGTGGLFAGFWRFTAPRGLAGVFQVVGFWLNTLLLGAFVSLSAAAVYTAAMRYVLVGSLALLAIINVIGPQLSELLARQRHERARVVYQTATCWLVLLTWPLYLALALFAPLLLRVFGPDYTAGASALAIMSGAMLVSMACGPVDVVLLMGGRSGWNLANTAVALGLNIGLNLVLTPRLGIEGAAIAWSAGVVANNVLPVLEVWRLMDLEPFGAGPARAAAIAAVSFGGLGSVVRATLGVTAGSFTLFAVAATVVYVGLCWRYRARLQLGALADAIQRPRRARTPPAARPGEV